MAFSPCNDIRMAMWNDRWGVSPSNSTGRLGPKHANGANFAFADGHVKWYKALPNTCYTWVPHPAVRDRVIPAGNNPPDGACRPAGQSNQWCYDNIN